MKKEQKNPRLNVHPRADQVLIKPEAQIKKTAAGILIPDTVKLNKGDSGVIVAVGPGKINEDGKVIPMVSKVGQTVLFDPGYDSEIEIDGTKYYLIHESSVRADYK